MRSTNPNANRDTMPPALRDERVEYENLSGGKSYCRARTYQMLDGATLIVLTDQSHIHLGTSVTNMIGRACYKAWLQLGQPHEVVFMEHYEWDAVSAERLARVHVKLGGKNPRFCSLDLPGGRTGYEFRLEHWEHVAYVDGDVDMAGHLAGMLATV